MLSSPLLLLGLGLREGMLRRRSAIVGMLFQRSYGVVVEEERRSRGVFVLCSRREWVIVLGFAIGKSGHGRRDARIACTGTFQYRNASPT